MCIIIHSPPLKITNQQYKTSQEIITPVLALSLSLRMIDSKSPDEPTHGESDFDLTKFAGVLFQS